MKLLKHLLSSHTASVVCLSAIISLKHFSPFCVHLQTEQQSIAFTSGDWDSSSPDLYFARLRRCVEFSYNLLQDNLHNPAPSVTDGALGRNDYSELYARENMVYGLQLLVNLFALSPLTVPEVFARVNSPQFSSRF